MNTKKKNARGITLIALVITIIVLLILAGVTINALSGESGTATITAKVEGTEYQATCTVKIIQKITTITAGNIEMNIGDTQKINVTTTPTEGLIEDLEYTSGSPEIVTVGADGNVKGIAEGTAVITIRGKNSRVSTTCTIKVTPKVIKITKITASDVTLEPGKTGKLNITIEPTNQTEGITYTSGTKSVATVGEDGTVNALTEGTTIITVKGKVSGVSTTCRVTVKSNKINGAIEVGEYEKYYGKKVTNYTAGGKTYRIFYIDTEGKFGDKNTVYLKADWTANDTYLTTYTPSGTDLETYKKLNPSWATQRGNSTSSWHTNEKAAAWLCSPSQWTIYCDTSKANYAIGSPTVEMYVASYNQVSHTTGNYTLGATYRETNVPGYIYTLDGKQPTGYNGDYSTNVDTLDYIGYNSMYCGKTENCYRWLASPSAYDYEYVCLAGGGSASLGNDHYGLTYGICPLISLKPDFQLEIEQ